jgi:hypothetical protein
MGVNRAIFISSLRGFDLARTLALPGDCILDEPNSRMEDVAPFFQTPKRLSRAAATVPRRGNPRRLLHAYDLLTGSAAGLFLNAFTVRAEGLKFNC